MWPLLAELAVGLLKQDANNRDIAEQRRHALAQGQIDILNHRAPRAGDPGYMQQAFGAARNFPRNPDNGANMWLGIASGLLKQNAAQNAEDAASSAARGGSALNDVDNLFGGRRVTDEDLLNDW